MIMQRQASGLFVLALALLAGSTLGACGKKLAQEDCDHLLGRSLGLYAFNPGTEVLSKEMGIYGGVPVDIAMLRKTARGAAKQAIADFDKACIGADDAGAIACGRRANNAKEFAECGGVVSKAAEAGKIARAAVTRKYSVDDCSKYAEHGVQVKAITADEVPKLVNQCEDWLEIGFYECRLASKDSAAWNACDHP
jgi:hypothetical protein